MTTTVWDEIRSLLIGDTALMGIVDTVDPVETSYTGDCILYQLTPTSNNGITKQQRLQITIIASHISDALAAEERVNALLLTPDDRPLTNRIRHVEQNGGGQLRDDKRSKYHRILYYDILTRSDINV